MVAQMLKQAGKRTCLPCRVVRATSGGCTAGGATVAGLMVVLVCDTSWPDWNTWSRRGAGTYSRGLPAEVSQ
jgi:hypothetical protein